MCVNPIVYGVMIGLRQAVAIVDSFAYRNL